MCWKEQAGRGQCPNGSSCRYGHNLYPNLYQNGQGGQQPKPKAKADAKAGKQGQNAKDKYKDDSRRQKLCKHIADPAKHGSCPKGGWKNCPYSHQKRLFNKRQDGSWEFVGKKKGQPKPQA